MAFQTLQHKLAVLVDEARAGKIQLPDFQRGYVWDDERVRQLLELVMGSAFGQLFITDTDPERISALVSHHPDIDWQRFLVAEGVARNEAEWQRFLEEE